MAKVDWQGLSTAIGQINQLIQPSYAAKKQIETDEYKEKRIWEHTLDELTNRQAKVTQLKSDYKEKFETLFTADASLLKDMDSEYNSGNAIDLNKKVGSYTLDSITTELDSILQESADITTEMGKIESKQRSFDFGKNFTIPLVVNPNAREIHMKGKPITIDGVTTYKSWDEDGSGSLSSGERNEAIANITELMIKSGIDINQQAFEAGYIKQKDDKTLIAEAKSAKALAVSNTYKSEKQTEEIKGKKLDNIKKLKDLQEGAEKVAFINSLDDEGLEDMIHLTSQTIELAISKAVIYEKDNEIVPKGTEGATPSIDDDTGEFLYDPAIYESVKASVKGDQYNMELMVKERFKRGFVPKDAITYNVLYSGGDFTQEEYDGIINDPIKKKAILDFYTASGGNWTPEDYELLRRYLTGELNIVNTELYEKSLKDFRVPSADIMRKVSGKVQEQE